MQFEGAHLRERARQGGWVDWWVVIVRRYVLDNPQRRVETAKTLEGHVGQPVILMAQDSHGVPKYWGRKDLVDYMANTPVAAVPWKRFTVNSP